MERESKKMTAVRMQHDGKPLRDILKERYNAVGLPKMAAEMGVSRGTVWYWIIREGLKIERKAVLR